MKLCVTYSLTFAVLSLLAGCHTEAVVSDAIEARPNILLIVADDLGYTDLASYGGEINTPNMTALSNEGISFTSFYSGPTCSPASSMMLTGVDSHRTGFGTMNGDWADNQLGLRGYEGHLNDDVLIPKSLSAEDWDKPLDEAISTVSSVPIKPVETESFPGLAGG